MSFTAKAELGALFINSRQVVEIWGILTEMGQMLIQKDYLVVMGIVTNIILPKATKAMGMWFHWLRDREQQKQFWYLWYPGTTNVQTVAKNTTVLLTTKPCG